MVVKIIISNHNDHWYLLDLEEKELMEFLNEWKKDIENWISKVKTYTFHEINSWWLYVVKGSSIDMVVV